jgi:hypothetical protein
MNAMNEPTEVPGAASKPETPAINTGMAAKNRVRFGRPPRSMERLNAPYRLFL